MNQEFISRRRVLMGGTIAGFSTVLGASSLAAQTPRPARNNAASDAAVLNNALFYEHQAIWAYGAAAGKLSSSAVGQAVKGLALKNQADHMAHRDALVKAVQSLGLPLSWPAAPMICLLM
jgi:hypothetical protein